MPISKLFPEANGFTLIEMLVVLSIMSLAAVLFIGSAGGSESLEKRISIAALEQSIQSARHRAVELNQIQSVETENIGHSFKPAIGSAKNLIFYTDGSSNGGVLTKDNRETIKIRWIDGMIVQ